MKRFLIGVAATLLGTGIVGATGLHTAAAAVDPVPTTVTLPLFGAPLTIGITTGPGGALTEVSVDPADNTVATHLRPHKVVFQSANPADPAADPAKVVVRSGRGGQSVSARAGSLAEVSGPGAWSGDVFGDGTTTTVNFTVGATSEGGPDITGITTTGATGVVGEVKYGSWDGHHDDESTLSARVSIKFTSVDGDQSRSVTISAKVRTDDDSDTSAKLSISLSRLKGVAVDAASAAGAHTWTGVLCDNSAATIAYTVAEDGTVSDVSATPDTGEIRTGNYKIDVRFSRNERVRIKVREHDGLIKISVDERIRCDSEDPTTNASTTVPSEDDDDNDDDNDGDHGDHGDWGGGRGGGRDHDGNTKTVSGG